MKILKRPDTSWSYKHTCSNCTAELEVEKDDVKHTRHTGDQRDPMSYDWDSWAATCPVCSENFSIPESSIPKFIQSEIKRSQPRDNGDWGYGYGR